ncbi:MAG: hypothetical protein ABJM43_22265 [Paracoccaceae bacterium]
MPPTKGPILAHWQMIREQWETLSVLSKGESKEIRVIDDDFVMVRMIPSLYSFTHNRSAMITGTDEIRLQTFEKLARVLRLGGIPVSAIAFGSDFYVSRRPKRRGSDYVPPIEVIVKARHVGTPKHTLYEISEYKTLSGDCFRPDTAHDPYVRFDYTNPLQDKDGHRLRDECIPSQLARHFIDVDRAEHTAMSAFCTLYGYLSSCGIRLDDICFKIDHTGRHIFGEISPDCMRAVWMGDASDFFAAAGDDTSKDTFRAGSSEETVLDRYRCFLDALDTKVRTPISPYDYSDAA